MLRNVPSLHIVNKKAGNIMPFDRCREQILSEDSYDFIVSAVQKELFETKFPQTVCEQRAGELYRSIYVNKELAEPLNFGNYPYNSIPKCYTLLDTNALWQAGITQVQNYPTLNLQGSGVLIGFVDTGIDFQNPIFQTLDKRSRIVSIWDQTIQDGTPPEGMAYGTEYTKFRIDEALQRENPLELVPSRDTDGHGTFVASVAAGGASEDNDFLGAAPDATIAMVKLKPAKQYLKNFYQIYTDAPCYQENDIMLGVTYLNQLAERLGLPLILCLALGTNMGGRTGNSPLAGILDIYGNISNRGIVIGAGNEAANRHHFLGTATNIGEEQETEIRVSDGVNGFCMEFWSDALELFAISIVSPSGEKTYRFPIRNSQTTGYTFILEGTEVTVDYKVFVEQLNAELIFLRFDRPAAGIWKIVTEPIQVATGSFHLWLPMTEFLEREVFFLQSNPDYTLTEPGSTLSALTVGFYNGNDNSVAISSGRGYTRSNRIKPDFVAPGVGISGAGLQNRYVTRSGSSVAAGITAGAAALLMEWVVYRLGQQDIDATQIRNLLVLGTQKRANETYPNREWGYGTLDVFHTFEVIRQI